MIWSSTCLLDDEALGDESERERAREIGLGKNGESQKKRGNQNAYLVMVEAKEAAARYMASWRRNEGERAYPFWSCSKGFMRFVGLRGVSE